MRKIASIEGQIILTTYKLSRLVNRSSRMKNAASNDLTMLQSRAMLLISEGKISMSDLSRSLNIKMPTATSLIDRLYTAGYIARVEDPEDRRKIYLQLTKRGNTSLQKFLDMKIKNAERVLKDVPIEDKKKILSVLENLIIKFEKEK